MKYIKFFNLFENYPDHFIDRFVKDIDLYKNKKIFFVSDIDLYFEGIDDSLITDIDNDNDFINLVSGYSDYLILWLYYTPLYKIDRELSMIKNKKFVLLNRGTHGEWIQKNLPGNLQHFL